jgi:flagellar protein FlaG
MPANEININTTPGLSPKLSEPPRTVARSSPKTASADAGSTDSVSIQDIGRLNKIKKDQSLKQITESVTEIREAIAALNNAMQEVSTDLHFSVDDISNRYIVEVTDSSTGEVIHQVPGEAILRMARQIESLKGILFDDKY